MRSVTCGIVFLGFGGYGVYLAITGQIAGVPPVAVGIVGGLFALPGLLIILTLPVLVRARKLIVNATAIDYQDPRGAGFTVRWEELAGIALSTRKESTIPTNLPQLRTTLVRLVLVPGDDDAFAQRHPTMDPLRRGNHYRLPFGHAPVMRRKLNTALAAFGGSRYAGVYDDGVPLSR